MQLKKQLPMQALLLIRRLKLRAMPLLLLVMQLQLLATRRLQPARQRLLQLRVLLLLRRLLQLQLSNR